MRVEDLKQTRFGKWPVTRRAPKPAAVRSAREGHAAGNRMAARVILLDIVKYGGEGALPVIWARLIEAKQVRRIEGPLFAATGRRAA